MSSITSEQLTATGTAQVIAILAAGPPPTEDCRCRRSLISDGRALAAACWFGKLLRTSCRAKL